ncbi:serine/threonine kinase [Aureococcus anophagefferens]|nr:serine/threonine kinase [Aureococcus anophagefferens]
MCRLARHIALASLLTITDSLETTKHLERLDAWLTNASAPPTHWRVRSPDDLDNRTDQALSGGARKDVWLSQLRDGRRVVVKALRHEGAFEFGDRASNVAYFELLFLEGLRGEPGIPELFGAYETPPFDVAHKPLVWATSNGGGRVATGTGTLDSHSGKKSEIKYSEVCDARARDAPLDLARAWLRCFRSFGERGGFVLTDFKPEQFTLDANGDIYLVDGPAPNSGPIAALARRHFTKKTWHLEQADKLERARIYVEGIGMQRPNKPELQPGAARPCPSDDAGAAVCALRTNPEHNGSSLCLRSRVMISADIMVAELRSVLRSRGGADDASSKFCVISVDQPSSSPSPIVA